MDAQREWFEKDYYKMLGVAADASSKEITKAYRKLAREWHPDKNPGDASAEERFKDLSTAYDVLDDDKKRAEYDEIRRLGPMAGGMRTAAAPVGSRSTSVMSATCRAVTSATSSVRCSEAPVAVPDAAASAPSAAPT